MVQVATVHTTDTTLGKFQENVNIAFKEVENRSFPDGKFIEDQVLTASVDTKFRHALGYTPKGYIVVKATQADFPTFVSADGEFLTLNNATGSDNTVTLWVF
jgi:hypothetical protein